MKRPPIHNLVATNARRRELRRNLTPAEALLKGSKLDGRKFRRQQGIGSYIADFYCPECRVIVELDGAGHEGPIAVEKDDRRTRFLERRGIRVVRFENRQVFENLEGVLAAIRTALRNG